MEHWSTGLKPALPPILASCSFGHLHTSWPMYVYATISPELMKDAEPGSLDICRVAVLICMA